MAMLSTPPRNLLDVAWKSKKEQREEGKYSKWQQASRVDRERERGERMVLERLCVCRNDGQR